MSWFRFRFQACSESLIPIPIPIPGLFQMFDSDSVSSKKWNHSGIDSDSGIGIVHHWFLSLSKCLRLNTPLLVRNVTTKKGPTSLLWFLTLWFFGEKIWCFIMISHDQSWHITFQLGEVKSWEPLYILNTSWRPFIFSPEIFLIFFKNEIWDTLDTNPGSLIGIWVLQGYGKIEPMVLTIYFVVW